MNKIFIFIIILKISFFRQLCFGSFSDLSELSSALATLANISQNSKPNHNGSQMPDCFFDTDFFSKLLERTKSVQLKAKLVEDVKKLQQLPTYEQQLAKYLLHFLFENKEFSARYLKGGLYPDYNFTAISHYLFADGSTDLITRILLAVTLVSDIEKNWILNEEIGIASLAGGYLLQDYILIKALNFRGYKKIRIYVIDPTNNTNNLEAIIKNDRSLKEADIRIEHYINTYQFLSGKVKAINLCYLVSPTGYAPIMRPTIKELLNGHLINVLQIGGAPKRRIRFYIPYDRNSSFGSSDFDVDQNFVKDIIKNINKSLRLQSDSSGIIDAFIDLEKMYPKNLYVVDDIMLDFYDIINHSSIKNCLGYMALEDQVRHYQNIQDEPYWALHYKIGDEAKNEIIWAYNSDKKSFEQL